MIRRDFLQTILSISSLSFFCKIGDCYAETISTEEYLKNGYISVDLLTRFITSENCNVLSRCIMVLEAYLEENAKKLNHYTLIKKFEEFGIFVKPSESLRRPFELEYSFQSPQERIEIISNGEDHIVRWKC